jgi:hypothetical protein
MPTPRSLTLEGFEVTYRYLPPEPGVRGEVVVESVRYVANPLSKGDGWLEYANRKAHEWFQANEQRVTEMIYDRLDSD